MGTTATKLTYLNTTKQKIKDSINNIGGNITSETPFRQYVAALESIYQSMPKVSGSGTTLSLSPTLKGLMQSTLKGNTSQVQLSGKNLFNYENTSNYVNSGNSSLTKIDNGIRISTQNVGINRFASVKLGEYSNFSGKTITISGIITPSSTNDARWQLWYMNSSNGLISQIDNPAASSFTKTLTTSPPTNTYYLALVFYNNRNVSVAGATTDFTFIQVEENSTATPYEQYCGGTPSPNPSYPQDIHNVSGNNSIVVCGKNLFDKNTMVMNSAIDAGNGNMTSSDNFRTAYIKCKPNTTYSISKILSNRFVVGFTSDKDLTLPKMLTNVWSNQAITTKTITSPNNAYYMFITLSKITDDTTPIQDILDSLQVEINETPTTYEAYNGTTYPINLPNGMELCKIGTYQDYFYKENDKWYLHKEIGKVVLDGSESDSDYGTGTTGSFTRFGYNPFQNTNLIKAQSDYVSNYFKYLGTIGGDTTEAGISNTAISNLNRLFIFLPTSLVSTISAFKTWLSTHNTSVYYQLATPTNTEITDSTLISQLNDIKEATSYNGTTNISQTNNDLPFIIDVSALLGSGS